MLGDSSIVIIIWVGFAVFSLLSILFYLGKGTSLIAGYNTASDAEKDKYDQKKMSIVMGSGMLVLALLQLAMAIFAAYIPFYVFYIFQGVLVLDCVVVVALLNTICKKK